MLLALVLIVLYSLMSYVITLYVLKKNDFILTLGLAPFILGFFSFVLIWLFNPSFQQYYAPVLFALPLLVLFYFYLKKGISGIFSFSPNIKPSSVLLIGIGLFLIGYFPLTQNDGLEYVQAAKVLFDSFSPADYPILNSSETKSGFYAPWTHPPFFIYLSIAFNSLNSFDPIVILSRIGPFWFYILTGLVLNKSYRLIFNRPTDLGLWLLFIVPLSFLGACFGLIDGLVIFGSSFILYSFIATEVLSIKSIVRIGVVMGLSMYSHSQSLMFPLLFFAPFLLIFRNKYSLVLLVKKYVAIGLISALVISPVYIWNYFVYGTIVSDSPTIFALKELNFHEYFTIGRGVGSLSSKIIYGFLKGFTSLESFNVIFFLWMCGFIVHLKKRRKGVDTNDTLALAAFLPPLIYMLLALVTVFLDIDVMIKNERYFLIILPQVVLGSAYFLECILDFFKDRLSQNNIIKYVKAPLGILFLLNVLVIAYHPMLKLGLKPTEIFTPVIKKLDKWSNHGVIEKINSIENDKLIYTFIPADMHYSSKKMLSFLDARCAPIYLAKNKKELLKELKKLNVGYLHVPNYSFPTIYNTKIPHLLMDEEWITLAHESNGFKLFSINGQKDDNKKNIERHKIDAKNLSTINKLLNIGGRKNLTTIKIGETENSENLMNIFEREFITEYEFERIPISKKAVHYIDVKISGRGLHKVKLKFYDDKGNVVNTYRSDDFVLNGQDYSPPLVFENNGYDSVKLIVDQWGASNLKVRD